MKLYKVTCGTFENHIYYVATDNPTKIYAHNFDFNTIIKVEFIADLVVLN